MKILFIVAHPDDFEFRMGGITVLYRELGYDVRVLSACNGNGGHHILSHDEIRDRRRGETLAVAKLLDIEYDIFSDISDCSIEADLKTRRRFIRYIREYSPDLIITHRPNDYHADHRAVAILVQDASYMLTVPHECPDVPAMREMPVIAFAEDRFTNPPFRADIVADIDRVAEKKFDALHLHTSQMYEWLPYINGDPREVPPADDTAGRMAFLKGESVELDTTDEEVMQKTLGYAQRFAKPAAKFRAKLIEKYGKDRGSRIRFAEAFEISEYGKQPTEKEKKALFPF